ncbi:MAG: hypothetical protein JSR83_12520 [Proteobacteria bacterium]|nr:hypothetical protein [Pseudomonadota bacterium]
MAEVRSEQDGGRRSWKRFPYGNRVYRYGGTALSSNWARLHRGDREPYPDVVSVHALLDANPALQAHVPDPAAAALQIEEAWRAYHAGDFADAVEYGLAAGPVGLVAAARAAVVYAAHLEEDELRRTRILDETLGFCTALTELAPNWANAWYVHGLALGRYSQSISVVKALARGLGGKVRDCLQRVVELDNDHADAYVALGVYNAEVIDKIGSVVAGLTYGARKEAVIEHFETARKLTPQSPVVLAEYARSTLLAFGAAQHGRAHELFAAAGVCQPVDALERLDVEWALGETE